MQWLAGPPALQGRSGRGLVAYLGTSGALANTSRSLAEEGEVAAHVYRFLTRFDHPAGKARIPVEPAAGDLTQVA